MRTIKVGFSVRNAFEDWTIALPDDAPVKITKQWLEANLSDCEFIGLDEAMNDGMDIEEIYESQS